MFVDRRRRDDPFLEWKVRLFSVAAALVLLGLYLDNRWVTGVAIVVLAVAMLLRFIPGGSARAEDLDAEAEDGEGVEGDAEDVEGDGEPVGVDEHARRECTPGSGPSV